MAIRGVYGFTVASVCFDTGNSMQMIKEQYADDQGTD